MALNLKSPQEFKVYNIKEFQDGIRTGIFTDSKGKAFLIINGAKANTYSVHIDRRIVSKEGQIVTFDYLLKEHSENGIKIGYIEKEIKLPSIEDYVFYKEQRKKKKDKKR